jgi:predicted AAA+ superfamily ATPase
VVKGQTDLSRRADRYYLPGLSFREFLQFEYNLSFSSLTLEQIIESHNEIAHNYFDNINVEKADVHY